LPCTASKLYKPGVTKHTNLVITTRKYTSMLQEGKESPHEA